MSDSEEIWLSSSSRWNEIHSSLFASCPINSLERTKVVDSPVEPGIGRGSFAASGFLKESVRFSITASSRFISRIAATARRITVTSAWRNR